MPGFMLNAQQMQTLIEKAGLGEANAGSPLVSLPGRDRPLHPDDPVFQNLVDQHLLKPTEDGWRVNVLFAGALRACLQPEEVLSVGVDQPGHPGYAVVRREQLWCECTVNPEGLTKLYFPLTRSVVIMGLMDALSGKTEEAEPTGFRFSGSAEDALVLATAMQELRAYPVSLPTGRLTEAVTEAASSPMLAGPFVAYVGSETIEHLAASPDAIEAAVERLVSAGHLRVVDGQVEVSEVARSALTSYPEACFGVTRTVIAENGTASNSLMVTRAGGRNLIFHVAYPEGAPPRFEWAEMNRQQVRALVAAMLLPGTVVAKMAEAKQAVAEPSGKSRAKKKTSRQAAAAKAKTVEVYSAAEPALKPKRKPKKASRPAAEAPAKQPPPERKSATKTPKFCRACGAKLKPGKRFCPQCGGATGVSR